MDYHKKVSDEALAMGVRAIGNDFEGNLGKDILHYVNQRYTQYNQNLGNAGKADIPAGELTPRQDRKRPIPAGRCF